MKRRPRRTLRRRERSCDETTVETYLRRRLKLVLDEASLAMLRCPIPLWPVDVPDDAFRRILDTHVDFGYQRGLTEDPLDREEEAT